MECNLNNTSTFKGYSNIYIQHVPKSTASTELTELVKGDGEIPIPLLHSIVEVTVSYIGVKSIYILENK